jgi:hypothetical protein
MAINISYQPSADVLSRAGYRVGAGMHRLQQQQMQQQERMQIRALQTQIQQNAFDRQFRANQMGAEQEFRAGENQVNRDFQREMQLELEQVRDRQMNARQAAAWDQQKLMNDAEHEWKQKQWEKEQEFKIDMFKQQEESAFRLEGVSNENALNRDMTMHFYGAGDDRLNMISEASALYEYSDDDAIKAKNIRKQMDENAQSGESPMIQARVHYELAKQMPIPNVRKVPTQEELKNAIYREETPGADFLLTKDMKTGTVKTLGTIDNTWKLRPSERRHREEGGYDKVWAEAADSIREYDKNSNKPLPIDPVKLNEAFKKRMKAEDEFFFESQLVPRLSKEQYLQWKSLKPGEVMAIEGVIYEKTEDDL